MFTSRRLLVALGLALAVTVALLALAGCGSSSGPGTTPSAGRLAGRATTTTVPTPQTAKQVGEALEAAGLPMKITAVYTEQSDPNKLLGRPGGYTSKIAFSDRRVKTDAEGSGGKDVRLGGSVEVFATAAGARRRGEYIQSVTGAIGFLGAEYNYLAGAVLLRVSGDLTPAQAKRYQAALQRIMRTRITVPTAATTP